jgi:predicted methyltransferase MtxX (methanogen marker protein 4)
MLSSGYSFKFLFKGKAPKTYPDISPETKTKRQPAKEEIDDKKRSFMKVAGVIGAGALATTLLPRKAEALVFGSTPASNVVGLKKIDNTRIDPAQETGGNLAAIAGKDFATQTTLATVAKESGGNLTAIAANTGNLNSLRFDNSSNLKITGTISGGGIDPVGLKDTTNTKINPATDDGLMYLRRMVRLMETQAATDGTNRQKITLDAITGSLTLGTVSAVGTINGWGDQMFQDVARNAYANGIRLNLKFS